MKRDKVSCYQCAHFFVTWEEKFPRGCKAMDFKSNELPSSVVYRASGMECLQFTPKSGRKKSGKS